MLNFLKWIIPQYFILGRIKVAYKFPHFFTYVPIFGVGGLEEWERKKRRKKWNKNSFWNHKLITKKSDFKQFTFGETVIINNFPQRGSWTLFLVELVT